MNLYKISGIIANGAYREKVYVYEAMVEKERSYTGLGKRISKQHIGQLRESALKDGYECYVLKEDDIASARKNVYEACLAIAKARFEHATADFEAAKSYSFPPVPITKKEDLS